MVLRDEIICHHTFKTIEALMSRAKSELPREFYDVLDLLRIELKIIVGVVIPFIRHLIVLFSS